jgi:membrane-associated phospholipid phosphatase
MDGRQYAERLRAQTLHAYARRNQPSITRPMPSLSGADVADRNVGALPIVNRGVLVNNDPMRLEEELNPPPTPVTPTPTTTAQQLLQATDILLAYNASISIPPTRGSRIHYIFFATAAMAYNWVTSQQAIQGTKDAWDWSVKYSLNSEGSAATFVTQALNVVLAALIPSYTPAALNASLTQEQRASIDSVKSSGNFTQWQTAWQVWKSSRDLDGSVAASVFPDPSTLPNGSTFLEVSQTQDFTNTAQYPNPLQWTPISINGAQKKYLTATWNSVRSTCLTNEQDTSIKEQAAPYKLTGAPKTEEIAALYAMVQNLTDYQKSIAEFWAGGPGTPSPPGIAIWMWRQAATLQGASSSISIYSGLDLAATLFEGSRLIWGLKLQFQEARPIQDIRRIYAGQQATKYDGTVIPANLWVPFQPTNFVTPPFPDFPSGHSTFSQILANVMTRWFGSALPTQTFTTTTGTFVAPILPAVVTVSLTRFPIAQGASDIQPGVVPAAPLAITFNTWQDMAESAGISRQCGGIHCESAHVGGQALANGLTSAVRDAWGILV